MSGNCFPRETVLQGDFNADSIAVKVLEACNIAVPSTEGTVKYQREIALYEAEEQNEGKRCLKLLLKDRSGTEVVAFEARPISWLASVPSELILKGTITAVNGVLFLTELNCAPHQSAHEFEISEDLLMTSQ